MAETPAPSASHKDRHNSKINLLYIRQEFEECLKLIEEALSECGDLAEYPIYVKALIKRHKGQIQESLQLFQQAMAINPHNTANLKQVGRSLYLLGKHKAAIEVYEEAQRMGSPDWEIMHNKGLCYMYLKQYERAIESFRTAIDLQPHDSTFIQLGKVYTLQDDYDSAIAVYSEALEINPENTEILTTLGLLFLRLGDSKHSFDMLGASLAHDPRNPRTILAAGSIIQDQADMDVALIKYRIAACLTPNSPQLWNNVGMCFFGKQRYIAAIACLKRALYLGPFEWIVAYNLGLVHLHTGQYASAFHHLSSSINLKPDFAHSYMYLAITLSRLDDFENACAAYDKAISMDKEPVFHLNYAVMLYQNKQFQPSQDHLDQFRKLFGNLDEESKNADPEVLEASHMLQQLLELAA